MKTAVKKFLGNYSTDVRLVNRLLVSSYLRCRDLSVDDNSQLIPYITNQVDDDYQTVEKFCNLLKREYKRIDLEVMIEFFEFVVSPSDKIVTGAIYTPQYIRNIIVDHVLSLINNRDITTVRIADIACGCGGFFLTLCEKLCRGYGLSCHDIYANILYGCDIESYCIERTKILLMLKALEEGERTDDLHFHLYKGNSLVFNWAETLEGFTGFDAIVGNPPYVTSAKMPEETKALLLNWEVCNSGKADLYIPFFQIAIELLNEEGVLGYITVSNFYRSLNGKALREYFANHQLNITIVDFGGEQVFKGCSTYTCLFFADKQQEGKVWYAKTNSTEVDDVRQIVFLEAKYEDLNHAKGWVIKNHLINNILQMISSTGHHLGEEASISNGIATLKNELYVLTIVGETEQEFIHEYKGRHYLIERGICRQVVKPSAMTDSIPFAEQIGQIIFPYEMRDGKMKCLDEGTMVTRFPQTYAYLQQYRGLLNERDKGTREYEQWFAYGRSQAIGVSGFRLLMPYIADTPTFYLSDIENLLYYNGFALVSDDIVTLERLQKILKTDIFWFYVMNISKPYANGYYSMGKRYIRYYGIPSLTEEQTAILDTMTAKEDIENLLYPLYFGNQAEDVQNIIHQYIVEG